MGGVAVRWRFRVLAWYEPRFGAGCGSLYYGTSVLLFYRPFNDSYCLFYFIYFGVAGLRQRESGRRVHLQYGVQKYLLCIVQYTAWNIGSGDR